MSVTYRPGGFCDVAVLPDGRFAHVVADQNVVTVYVADGVFSQIAAPENLLFCRSAYWNSQIVSVHQGNGSGSAYLLRNRSYENLGPTFGVQPVAIDSQYVYVVRSNQSYDRIALETGEIEHLPHGAPGSSQGIRGVPAVGVVIWADNTQVATFARGDWSIALHQFTVIDPIVVGQADPPQIALVNARAGERFTAIPGEAYEPHLAQSGDRYAIVARTPHGAAYVEVPPYQQFVGIVNPRPPIVTPRPQPPIPEPAPVPVMPNLSGTFADAVQTRPDLLAAYRAAAADGVARNWPEDAQAAHAAVREKLVRIGAFAVFQQDPNFGLLRKDGGAHGTRADGVRHALAILVYRPTMALIQVLSDTGPIWAPLDMAKAENARPAEFWIQPTAEGSAPPAPTPVPVPVPTPTPPPAPTVDLSVVLAEIAALKSRVELLERVADSSQGRITNAETTLHALANRKYRVSGKTRTAFGHQHVVDLEVTPE